LSYLVRLSSLSSAAVTTRDLHSFPTRRSSDLGGGGHQGREPHQGRAGAEGGLHHRLRPHVPAQVHYVIAVVLQEHLHDVLSDVRSEEHTSELQSRFDLVCRLLLEKKKM